MNKAPVPGKVARVYSINQENLDESLWASIHFILEVSSDDLKHRLIEELLPEQETIEKITQFTLNNMGDICYYYHHPMDEARMSLNSGFATQLYRELFKEK